MYLRIINIIYVTGRNVSHGVNNKYYMIQGENVKFNVSHEVKMP